MTGTGTIQQVLAATDDGVGCRHRFEPEPGINMALLTRLGLVVPINTRIPRCSDHGCPLLGKCSFQPDFDSTQTVRSRRKFRLTPEGLAAAHNPAVIAKVVEQAPEAAQVLAALRDGATNIFDLAARLLDTDIQRLESGNAPSEERLLSRRELGALLRLLAELGLIELGADNVTLSAVSPGA